MYLFNNTLFINLEHRKDRLEHASREFKKMNIDAERVDAIKHNVGAIGCSMSHIKCLEIAKKINLEKFILTFNPKNKKIKIEDKIVSDSCEALIGAIYLDKGLIVVEKVILNLWKNKIKESVITQIDAKTKLQELALKNFKKLPVYKLISNTGPRHKPSFNVGVKLPNTKYFFGLGKSKKDAEQNAAIECLKSVRL